MHYKMKIALSHLSFDFVIQSLMNIGTSKLQLACTNAGRKTTVNILYYKGGIFLKKILRKKEKKRKSMRVNYILL